MTLTDRLTIDDLWQQFFWHLRAKRRSKATLTYYGCTQRVFRRFLVASGLPQQARELTTAHLRAFLRSLEGGQAWNRAGFTATPVPCAHW